MPDWHFPDPDVSRVDLPAPSLRSVFVAAVIFLVLLWSFPSLGHGLAFWIEENEETAWCCGPDDCQPIPDEAVTMTPSGYEVTIDGRTRVFHYRSKSGLYPSIDQRFWMCRAPDGWPRCLFTPAWGS